MPGNSCGPGRARGHKGTTAGTAPRPEGCSRARRRRTGAGRTGSGGRGTCASQRRAASTRATPLPPLRMSLSVMSGVPARLSGCSRFRVPLWPLMATTDSSAAPRVESSPRGIQRANTGSWVRSYGSILIAGAAHREECPVPAARASITSPSARMEQVPGSGSPSPWAPARGRENRAAGWLRRDPIGE
jgi:hypothetical protein